MKITTILKAVKEDATPEQLCKQHNFGPGWLHAVKKVIAASKKIDPKSIWGWCTVDVVTTVELGGQKFVGRASIGGCSYESEADFLKDGEHYTSLIKEATAEAMDLAFRPRPAGAGDPPFTQYKPQPVETPVGV